MRLLLLVLFLFSRTALYAQDKAPGLLTGTVMDSSSGSLEGATVQLMPQEDSLSIRTQLTGKDGGFFFRQIPYGYFRLKITYTGFQTLTLDSIHFREERSDFNLNELVLQQKRSGTDLSAVVVYSEKPLVQSKDGNITFNTGESALSAGSSASDLLANTPLVSKDPSGKILVRGKEPRILIDDKPVELNLQQLQDLLESLPGSAIEKIEVMTNPPPQYANEQGGVINIVTKKGRVGISGRLSVYGGTRGETGMNGSFHYRKKGMSLNINAGTGYSVFGGSGYSIRQNIYEDSVNLFRTENDYRNKSFRPNIRASLDYDLSKTETVNLVLQFNGNGFNNHNNNNYRNFNRFEELYRYSTRTIGSTGYNSNPHFNATYTLRSSRPGQVLRIFVNGHLSLNESDRNFYQRFFQPDGSAGSDSLQQQLSRNGGKGYNVRLNYDLPLDNKKTSFSFGSFFNRNSSDIEVDARYKNRQDGSMQPLDALTNDFIFYQRITHFRASVRHVFVPRFSVTAGLTAEATGIRFDLQKEGAEARNGYWNLLPFVNLNRNWEDKLNLTFSWRRTIRRPGIGELNPSIDFSDPYTIRFGNPELRPSLSQNFDLVLGKTKPIYYANLGFGYNNVSDVFSTIRTRSSDNVTEVTWQNISGRKEYELSSWGGYTVSKRVRLNANASYTYNRYSLFDKVERRYRDGGSFTSNLNSNFNWKDLYSATVSGTFNRFANPQGSVRSSLSMNLGLQAKLLQKKMTLTLNVIDPLFQQENRSFTYASNYALESFSLTRTRNYRLSLSYNFVRKENNPLSNVKRSPEPKVPGKPKK